MTDVVVFVASLALGAIGIAAAIKRRPSPPQPLEPRPAPQPDQHPTYTCVGIESKVHRTELVGDYGEADRLITHWIDHNKDFERYIFGHIAGVTFPNHDGSSRQYTLRSCKPLDRLVLRWEQDNPVSQTAVAVHLETGEQLGYLESRLGKDTLKRIKKGERWIGFIVSIGVPSRSDIEVLGATIVIVKVKQNRAKAA